MSVVARKDWQARSVSPGCSFWGTLAVALHRLRSCVYRGVQVPDSLVGLLWNLWEGVHKHWKALDTSVLSVASFRCILESPTQCTLGCISAHLRYAEICREHLLAKSIAEARAAFKKRLKEDIA